MKIKGISDSHNDHNQLELDSGDILIHSGDAGTKGNYTEGLNFLWWFVKQPYKYKILVPGNHDHKLRTKPELIMLAHDMGIIVLNDDFVEIEGLKIYGVSTTFCDEERDNANYNPKLSVRAEAWKNIPEGLDILITHMPPKHILDANGVGNPIGCSQLTERVKIAKPKLHLFGHNHSKRDKTVLAFGTKFRNIAVKDDNYFTTHFKGYDIEDFE